MNKQLKHNEIIRTQNHKEIILIADGLQLPSNYGGLIRTAESFGVKQLWFISPELKELSPKMKRVSRSAEKHIDIQFSNDILEILTLYMARGFQSLALEFTNKSTPIGSFTHKTDKIILICGNENSGISPEVLEKVHHTIHIPVVGTTSSLNVVVATGIALNHLVSL